MVLLTELGFIIHRAKSSFIPQTEIVILGVVLNLITMTDKITKEKALTIKKLCSEVLHTQSITICRLARVVGKLVSDYLGNWGYAWPALLQKQ